MSPREMSCPEVADTVTAYLDGALDAGERERFEAHTRSCQPCRLLVAQSLAVVESLRGLEEGPTGAVDPAKERLLSLFHEHGFHRPGRRSSRIPLGLGRELVAPGDHLAYLWESDRDFREAAGFVAAGAAEGETCVLLGDEEVNDRIESAGRRAGLDTAALQRQGRLRLASGMGSADAMLEFVAEQIELAVDRGSPLVRILGNLGWGRPGWPDDLDLLRLEARVTEAVRKLPVVVMCAYDVRHLEGRRLLLGGLECHPLTYRRGALRTNELYVPTDEFLAALPGPGSVEPPA